MRYFSYKVELSRVVKGNKTFQVVWWTVRPEDQKIPGGALIARTYYDSEEGKKSLEIRLEIPEAIGGSLEGLFRYFEEDFNYNRGETGARWEKVSDMPIFAPTAPNWLVVIGNVVHIVAKDLSDVAWSLNEYEFSICRATENRLAAAMRRAAGPAE